MIRGSGMSRNIRKRRGSRAAAEAPNTLESRQVARVIDLVSEGEIKGLVNGLQSIYLNDTKVENKDGTLNFKGVTIETRNGTQSQLPIKTFGEVESSFVVGQKIEKDTPITKTIVNGNAGDIDTVRVTVSVPRLTLQNITTGDLNGSSVSFKISVDKNGGGFVDQPLNKLTVNLTSTDGAATYAGDILSASINVGWEGIVEADTYQTISYTLEYSIDEVSWASIGVGSFAGTAESGNAPTGSRNHIFSGNPEDTYFFRVAGTGLSLSGTAVVGEGGSEIVISGKTTSKYQQSYDVPIIDAATYQIRVTRLTEDAPTTATQNDLYWDVYTEVNEEKFSYPNSAIVALELDSTYFSAIPTRGYEIEGVIIQVPTNYNPLTRVYTGVWDGTFTTAWSDNPAWVFYDMLTNSRYGIGSYLSASQIDKWGLYTIAKYCDVMVSTGLGGKEPRFTCNLYLQDRRDVFSTLQAMASAFRSIIYWANGSIVASQDAPADPVALFTPANVIDGSFNYEGTSARARHTAALVSWNNPKNLHKQEVEYVEDTVGIARYGVNQIEVAAVGCNSQGQAHRFGRAMLYSERLETESISFETGMDGLVLAPNDVIQTTDPIRAGVRMGGRIVSATTTTATIDAEITLDSGVTYTLYLIMPSGAVESQPVTTSAGAVTVLTASAFSDTAQNNSIWILAANNLAPEEWRIVSITEESGNAKISALKHTGSKYAEIETGVVLDPAITRQAAVPEAVTDLIVTETMTLLTGSVVGVEINVSWNGQGKFRVRHKRENGNWQEQNTTSRSVDISAVAGSYEIEVTGINDSGIQSTVNARSIVVYGLTKSPDNVGNFQLNAISGSAYLTWTKSTDLDVLTGGAIRIRHSSESVTPSWSDSVDIGGVIAGAAISATLPLSNGSYLAKFIDSSGNYSDSETIITTTAPNIIAMNVVANLNEDAFAGAKTGVAITDAALALESAGLISGISLMSAVASFATIGGVKSSGEYDFSNKLDLGSVQTSRLTAVLTSAGYDALDMISMRGTVSGWTSIIGSVIHGVNARLLVRTSADNVTFGAWGEFKVGDYSARSFEFKAELTSSHINHNIAVSALSVQIDMADRVSAANDVTSGAGTYSITYPVPFIGKPAIGVTAENMATGDYYELSNQGLSGFDIIFKNASGTAVSRTFDHIERGY